MKLNNKVAIITGASSGIGLAIAKKFKEEGAIVVMADRNDIDGAKLATELNLDFIKTDVSQSADIQNVINATVAKYGRLDIMVNNAGIGEAYSVQETSEENFDRVIAINLKSVFLGTKYAALAMKEHGGVILSTASILGQVGFQGAYAYCASKGGIVQMTKAAALDLAPYKIRVNAVAPAFIKTNMTNDILNNPDSSKALLRHTPLGRFGTPEEMANIFCFLASDEASYVTGAVYSGDGGWLAM
ncbi:MAG TPA: SDR family NAD(P)-dependent oxidoreductase [Candidatus Paceibacterota bacterium]|nr:SDR family NAD(P)-dependent oxidoreductase [Candidatus Paceibacterota bacterium]